MDDALPIPQDAPRPGITGAPLRDLHPAWIKAERIGWWIFDAVVLIPTAIVAGLIAYRSGEPLLGAVLFLIWTLLAAIMLWATLAYPTAAYRHAGIALGELGLEFRRGVWWRKTTIIPRSRVQHTDVSQGPVMRRFGLGKLVIHTAGTRNAVVEIPGLALDEAERIRDRLLDRAHPQPADAQPTEAQPTDPQPADPHSADNQPADSTPAPPAPPEADGV